ncbi:uncharacterized protein LOC107611360 [Arachis ipaensis]|uniref:uncharacterized protein LOC107611360 n=1 Tax=Arachis ipaensis TaxID=130454 RepID=UPI0007AF4721|nr:uncharacterized protein LOC107611360 [Arachis ipaensis]XP_025628586.1 uncharacterized protein LOC112721772 [Arachis hypogaea]
MGLDHRRLYPKVIAQYIFNMVKTDPTISIRVLQRGVENHFGYKASYRKVWLAKQRVITRIYGDWEESYNELPRWLFAMQMYLPGKIQYIPWPGAIATVMFLQVFWTFPPCVEAFKHCKPLISIDGTHLYGIYGGTLLMAIAQDGNANILPIAFAIVEEETKEAWSFFLLYLQQHVTPKPDVLVILDRLKSVDAALNADESLWKPLHAFQVFCARHIAANFMSHFKNKDLKKILYADEGRQFGHMTTNISECINAVMKGSHNLPIITLVKSSYFYLGELFARKGSEALA